MAENDFDYLDAGIQQQDGAVLKNLAQMGEKLKELKVAMETAVVTAEQATKAYEHYANRWPLLAGLENRIEAFLYFSIFSGQ